MAFTPSDVAPAVNENSNRAKEKKCLRIIWGHKSIVEGKSTIYFLNSKGCTRIFAGIMDKSGPNVLFLFLLFVTLPAENTNKAVTMAKDKYVRFEWAKREKERIANISRMRAKGYDDNTIAELLDLAPDYVKGH
jgi:hypothetical protein